MKGGTCRALVCAQVGGVLEGMAKQMTVAGENLSTMMKK
jgi:hypothetical protein